MKHAARVAGVAVLLAMVPLPAVQAAEVGTYTVLLPMGDWRPTVGDLVNALDTLKHDAPGWERRIGRRLRDFPQYRFQYWGERRGRKRIIHLNAFCSAFWDQAPDWRERLVVVMDGGSCFFQAEVDADSGAVVAFHINGEA